MALLKILGAWLAVAGVASVVLGRAMSRAGLTDARNEQAEAERG